jgi:uncharacterized protein YcbX
MHLSGLFIYPVKSLRGCAVASADVDPLGLVGDRRFLLVDADGRFLTQRTLPRMALIATELTADQLLLRADGAGQIAVRRQPDPAAPLRNVSVWKSTGLLAEDCGDEPARWLSDFLKTPCRLVRIGEKFLRPILKPDVAGPGDLVTFADGYPFLALGETSLADLNTRLAAAAQPPVPMDRFRPNLVLAGSDAYAEDTWTRFRIGDLTFRAAGPCSRCSVPTVDQVTGENRGPEPLCTLARYRRRVSDPSQVDFGQNIIHETKSGTLHVGDALTVL